MRSAARLLTAHATSAIALAVAVAVLTGAPGIAAAQVGVSLAVVAGAGYTDNALSVPAGSTELKREGDEFANVEPDLGLSVDGRRLVAILHLGGRFSQYATDTGANTRIARVAAVLQYDLAPTWKLDWDLTGTIGEQGLFQPLDLLGAAPAGGGIFTQLVSSAVLQKNFSQTWRGGDSVHVSLAAPLEDGLTLARTISVGNTIDAQVSLKRDALGLSLSTSWNHTDPPGPTVTPTDSLFLTAQGTYLHELSSFWEVHAAGGAGLTIDRLSTGVAPVGSLSLAYRSNGTELSAGVAEGLVMNTLLGVGELRSEAHLQLVLQPVTWATVRATATAVHAAVIGSSSSSDSVRLGPVASLSLSDNVGLDVSYSFSIQRGSAGPPAVPDLQRSTVFVSVRGSLATRREPVIVTHPGTLQVRQSEERDAAEAQPR